MDQYASAELGMQRYTYITCGTMTKVKVSSASELLNCLRYVMTHEDRQILLGGGQIMPPPFSFLSLSLGDYGAIVSSDDFIEIVERSLKHATPNASLESLTARQCLAWCRFVYDQQRRVEAAFSSIPDVGLSLDEMASGFDNLRFGLFGLVDRMARRQGITDEEARRLRISDVIGKLTIDAKTAICNKNIQRLWQSRYTTQRLLRD